MRSTFAAPAASSHSIGSPTNTRSQQHSDQLSQHGRLARPITLTPEESTFRIAGDWNLLEALRLQDLIDSGSCVTLESGKSIVQQVDIGKLYLFDTAGKYFIRLRRPDPESAGMVKSNLVSVTITASE
jgi:hypothetical protein